MRDRDPLAPELLTTGESGAGAFAEVALRRDGETQRFRFGISEPALAVLRSILATRASDAMPGVRHRYFYAAQGGRGGERVTHLLYVRVEQGRDARMLACEAPRELVGVLHWFRQLPTLADAAHLVAPT